MGFIVSKDGITTNPKKVEAILNYEEPTNLFNVRSFLGLASYYRCFIKDFASKARPLNDILKGENRKVSATHSKKIPVLSQNGKPLTMISRSLKSRELGFATNEPELLAIVWALNIKGLSVWR